jgi:hypothetical protein
MRIRRPAALVFPSIAPPAGSARAKDEFAIGFPGLTLLAGAPA